VRRGEDVVVGAHQLEVTPLASGSPIPGVHVDGGGF
jgi:hypothetical protein